MLDICVCSLGLTFLPPKGWKNALFLIKCSFFAIVQPFWNFAQRLAIPLPYAVQNFDAIGLLTCVSWTNIIQSLWFQDRKANTPVSLYSYSHANITFTFLFLCGSRHNKLVNSFSAVTVTFEYMICLIFSDILTILLREDEIYRPFYHLILC